MGAMPGGPMMETLGTLIETFDSWSIELETGGLKDTGLSNQSLAFAWTV